MARIGAGRIKGQRIERMTMVAIATRRLIEEPHASIIGYPKSSRTELNNRLKELQKLRITGLEFSGQKQVLNVHVLGKGCVGIVTVAYKNSEKVALKIRRTDADRTSMLREAKLLKKANAVDVGPKLLAASRNFLLMQFVDGELLPKWLEKRVSRKRTKTVLLDVLEQCWRLDVTGLDHGELSHAPKHIIITKEDKAFIVDFETASPNRRASNVTSICQFFFISESARKVNEKLGERDKKAIINALRRYKAHKKRSNFERVLESCGLQTT